MDRSAYGVLQSDMQIEVIGCAMCCDGSMSKVVLAQALTYSSLAARSSTVPRSPASSRFESARRGINALIHIRSRLAFSAGHCIQFSSTKNLQQAATWGMGPGTRDQGGERFVERSSWGCCWSGFRLGREARPSRYPSCPHEFDQVTKKSSCSWVKNRHKA